MKDFWGMIYCWFEPLFGTNLAEHLWGFNCETQAYTNSVIFNGIGFTALGVSLAMVAIYYYGINHPRFNRWWSWSIMLGVTVVIGLIIGFSWTANHFLNGFIGDCLMYERDADGNIISTMIYQSDCWMFGVANMIVCAIFFIIFSFAIKWWSRNAKYSPF